jgi:hydroxymethylpyrimidine/phosphomethylpyrimidine kinase
MSGPRRRRASNERLPVVLALSGLEPSGRAGLLADLETIRLARGRAAGIATALTAQGKQIFVVAPAPNPALRAQIEALHELAVISAVKLGMVWDREALRLILRALSGVPGYRVIDPVTRTSSGKRLSTLRPGDYLAAAAQNVVLTPNVGEASWLLSHASSARTAEQAARLGEKLLSYGFAAVIVKGGHLAGRATDAVCHSSGVEFLEGRRIRLKAAAGGTGCRFASALATVLARGRSMAASARAAKALVRGYLAQRVRD